MVGCTTAHLHLSCVVSGEYLSLLATRAPHRKWQKHGQVRSILQFSIPASCILVVVSLPTQAYSHTLPCPCAASSVKEQLVVASAHPAMLTGVLKQGTQQRRG